MSILNKIINQIKFTFLENSYYQDKKVINNIDTFNSKEFNIVTIAFNNPKVIEYQIKLIKKYIIDDYTYTVFDNSSKDDASLEIEKICKKYKVKYYKYSKKINCILSPSESHAVAINYAVKNYVIKSNSRYFVLLDHDIFPIAKYSFRKKIKNQVYYGLKNERNLSYKKYYYIWPGFCVLDLSKINNNKIDFMVSKIYKGDTGAKNYFKLYSKINSKDYKYASFERKNIICGNDDQESKYDLIDEKWIHMINAGQWKKTNRFSEKENKIYEMLKEKM